MEEQEGGLTQLIEALQILKKYGDPRWPTYCEHDVLRVAIDPSLVSEEDMKALDVLGFFRGSEEECFQSFKFGSC